MKIIIPSSSSTQRHFIYTCLAIAINKKRLGIWATLIGGERSSPCDENYRIRTKARKLARAAGAAAAAAPAPPLQLHCCTVLQFLCTARCYCSSATLQYPQLHSCTVLQLCSFHALPAATLGYQELQGCTVVQLLCSHCTSCTGMCATSVCIKCPVVLCS